MSTNKRRKTNPSPTWEELAADVHPLIQQRRSRYHDHAIIKDSLQSAMQKLWPNKLRANECTEELLYIRSLAFRLSDDISAKQLVDQAIYDLPFDHTTQFDTLIATKKIIYELFAIGLVGLCIIKGPVQIMKTSNLDPHDNMMFVANMFIIAVKEAYEPAFNATVDKNWQLKRMIKPGAENFKNNCKVLRAVMEQFGPEGIELNGACSTSE